MYILIVNIGYAVLLINLILYGLGYSKNDKSFKIFTIYLIGTAVIQVASKVCKQIYNNNLFLSHFYFIGQFIVLYFFFKNLFVLQSQKKIADYVLLVGIVALTIQYALEPQVFFKFSMLEIFITSFLVLILASIHLYNMLTDKKVFYYCTIGILLYLFSSTVLFFVGNLTAFLSKEYQFLPWTLNAFLVIVYQLFILFEWKISYYKRETPIYHEN